MSRKQEKENRQMLKEQQKKDAQKQKEQARENFRQIREQEAEERNLRNQLVQNVEKEERPVRPPKKELSRKEEKSEKVQEVPDLLPMSWTASYIPLKQVKNGIIQTSDNRFVKIVEVLPINFLLRSSSEQRSIILSFMSYLKIAPPNIQLLGKLSFFQLLLQFCDFASDLLHRLPAAFSSFFSPVSVVSFAVS